MASVRRFSNSRYWYACYTLPDGKRVQTSTKLTNKKDAQKIADEFELATRRNAGESKARRHLREIYRNVHSLDLPGSENRAYVEGWLKRKELETSDQTAKKYAQVMDDFLEFLGEKSKSELADISSREIIAFRDTLARRVSPSTVNNALKVIRVLFADARREGLIDSNPAEIVKTLARKETKQSRRAFTLEELKRLLENCDQEWRGLVFFGIYTGQRLGDLARLTWANIDLQRQEIRLLTHKTNRQQIIPIATSLMSYVEKLTAGDNPQQPLFPRSFDIVQRQGDTGYLSSQFNKVLVSCGLARAHSRGAKKDKNKDDDRRTLNDLSFHSLRHSATSFLKNAGVNNAVAQDIIGHETAAMSAHYTHIDELTKRKALELMPNLTAEG